MEKAQTYRRVRFVPDAIQELENYIITNNLAKPGGTKTFKVHLQGEETWDFDNFDEFLAEYPKAVEATYLRFGGSFQVHVTLRAGYDAAPNTNVSISAPNREIIQKLFNIVEKYRERSMFHLLLSLNPRCVLLSSLGTDEATSGVI